MALKLNGVFTALITPFKADTLEVDYPSLEKLIDNNIAAGVDGLVPIGTTGESPTLSADEKEKIIKLCVSKAKGKCKVIAGTGSNNTEATVKASEHAKSLGVDAVLIVNPYYNKPSQEGLYQHVMAVDKVGVPIVLYNIPGRSSIAMTPSTIARIYTDATNVVAVKEATGSLDNAIEIRSLCDISILSGDDAITQPLMAIGGSGVVSVLSNYKPEIMKVLADPSDFVKSAQVLKENYKLIKSMFCETNPVPVKYAMYLAGEIESPVVRQPLVEMEESNQVKVSEILKEYKFI